MRGRRSFEKTIRTVKRNSARRLPPSATAAVGEWVFEQDDMGNLIVRHLYLDQKFTLVELQEPTETDE